MTAAKITRLRPLATNEDGLSRLIGIVDRLGMLANKAKALNLAIRGLDEVQTDSELISLDYLSDELAHEIESYADELGEKAKAVRERSSTC